MFGAASGAADWDWSRLLPDCCPIQVPMGLRLAQTSFLLVYMY